MRIALVQEDGQAVVFGNCKLSLERAPLRIRRREIAKVVEAALANRDAPVMAAEFTDGCIGSVVVIAGMVRVNAGRRVQEIRLLFRELQRPGIARDAAASHDDRADAGVPGVLQHLVAVVVKTVVREVRANVDQVHVGFNADASGRSGRPG